MKLFTQISSFLFVCSFLFCTQLNAAPTLTKQDKAKLDYLSRRLSNKSHLDIICRQGEKAFRRFFQNGFSETGKLAAYAVLIKKAKQKTQALKRSNTLTEDTVKEATLLAKVMKFKYVDRKKKSDRIKKNTVKNQLKDAIKENKHKVVIIEYHEDKGTAFTHLLKDPFKRYSPCNIS